MALRVWSARLGLPLVLRGEDGDDTFAVDDTTVVVEVAVVVMGEVNATRRDGDALEGVFAGDSEAAAILDEDDGRAGEE